MKIAVTACNGKMGKEILQIIYNDPNLQISGGLVRKDSKYIGMDLGRLAHMEDINIQACENIEKICQDCDAIIDFSSPDYSLEILNIAKNHSLYYICGTTGFSDAQFEILKEYAKYTSIIWSANMSIGINILAELTFQLGQILDEEFDIEIIEAHHKHKIDSPSGTALMLGNEAAKARNINLKDRAIKSRDGIIGKRPKGDIGFAAVRGGDIIGDHTVLFAGEGERIELSHKASNRSLFAKGAVTAAKFADKHKIKPGLYSMKDVLFAK